MSKKIYRKCKCCGKEYEYCGHCGQSGKEESWRNLCDTKECREILNIVSAYNLGLVGIEKVTALVSDYGIKDTSDYLDGVRTVLDLATPKAPVEEERPKRRHWKTDVDFAEDEASE